MTSAEQASGPLKGIAALLDAGAHRAAWAAMVREVGASPSSSTAQGVAGLAALLDAAAAELVATRVAVLANFTFDPVVPALVARGLASRLLVRPFVAEFDTWPQELMNPGGSLAGFAPQTVILALRLELLCPPLAHSFLELSATDVTDFADGTIRRIGDAVRAFRGWSNSKVLLHSFPAPVERALGIIDATHPRGQTGVVSTLNARLHELINEVRDLYIVDTDVIVARVGASHWNDERLRAVAKLPLTATALQAAADEYLRYLRAFNGLVRKVLVLDLDNTLWGGILGEDGPDGIVLGDVHPGTGFVDLQRAILQLHRRGVVLAINSHNNPEDVAEVLGKHPEMVLKPEHFSATRINWQDKAANMTELAEELGLGLDSFVFLDDSEVHCERVRTALPEVLTIQQQGDVSLRAAALRNLGVFDTLSFSDEDRARGSYYRMDVQRTTLQRSIGSVEDFLRSLQMELVVETLGERRMARAADLTQRTNQFNLTTRRYTVADLQAFTERDRHEGFVFSLRDRFGDSGVIGLALLAREEDVAVVDTLLISCRVLKRSVEDAVLAFLSERACATGASSLRGLFRPTKKNAQVAEFFPTHGFVAQPPMSDGTFVFERRLDDPLASPSFVRVIIDG